MTSLTVLLPQEGESWSQLLKRAEDERGELLIVLTGYGAELESGAKERDAFLSACARLGGRARFAVREKVLITGLRSKGLRIIDRVRFPDASRRLPDAPGGAACVFTARLAAADSLTPP